MGWSERFRVKNFTAFSYTLKALGSGIAYLTLWASLNIYHLFPAWLAFCLMVAVTVTNALFALTQESELLAGYALLGGLVTPALLSAAEDNEVFVFGYLLVLATGSVLLFGLRSWLRLTIAAFAGISIYFFSWYVRFYQPGQRSTTLVFIALFFAVFSATPFLILRQAQATIGLGVIRRFVVASPVAISARRCIPGIPARIGHPQRMAPHVACPGIRNRCADTFAACRSSLIRWLGTGTFRHARSDCNTLSGHGDWICRNRVWHHAGLAG